MGTEWGRTLYPNIWVDATLRYIEEFRPQGSWVISDVRFKNELTAIREKRGFLVRLLRGEQRFSHASEAELGGIDLGDFDHVIDNEGTLEEFYDEIDLCVAKCQHLADNV